MKHSVLLFYSFYPPLKLSFYLICCIFAGEGLPLSAPASPLFWGEGRVPAPVFRGRAAEVTLPSYLFHKAAEGRVFVFPEEGTNGTFSGDLPVRGAVTAPCQSWGSLVSWPRPSKQQFVDAPPVLASCVLMFCPDACCPQLIQFTFLKNPWIKWEDWLVAHGLFIFGFCDFHRGGRGGGGLLSSLNYAVIQSSGLQTPSWRSTVLYIFISTLI